MVAGTENAESEGEGSDDMRVTCTMSPKGPIYRLYRSSDAFVTEMRSLIPFLHQADCDLSVGGSEDDPSVVLIVGPLSAELDKSFRQRIARFLEP